MDSKEINRKINLASSILLRELDIPYTKNNHQKIKRFIINHIGCMGIIDKYKFLYGDNKESTK
jgi:hypothetical protein